jgi:hypothetical protein
MPDVTQALRDARDLLVANRDNPKALGDFGYSVDDCPQAKAKPICQTGALNRVRCSRMDHRSSRTKLLYSSCVPIQNQTTSCPSRRARAR